MPSRLKIYFWLIAAIAAYWLLSVLWFIVFPPEAVVLALAKIPPAVRVGVEERAWTISFVSSFIRAALFVGLAWFAAFRRQNWARWGVLVLFVAIQVIPLILAARFGRLAEFAKSEYAAPQADLVFALFVIAIVLSFTGDARAAFAHSISKQ